MITLDNFTTSQLHRLAASERRAAAGMGRRIDIKAALLDRCPTQHRALVEQHIARMGPPPARLDVATVAGNALGINWRSAQSQEPKPALYVSSIGITDNQRGLLFAAWRAWTDGKIIETQQLLHNLADRWPRFAPLLRIPIESRDLACELGDLAGLGDDL